MAHYQLVEGRLLARPNEIMIGKTAAKNYKVGVGDTITLYDNRYKIVGLYETGVAYEDGGSVIALREAQRVLNRPRSVSFIFVDVVNPDDANAVRAALERRFPDAQASLSSQFAEDSDAKAQMDAFAAVIGILAMLVGGIVVANTMMMSIYERTREIGTLRALGWPKRSILSQVVQESLWLCLVAGVLGSVLGVVMLWGISKIPMADSMIMAVVGPADICRCDRRGAGCRLDCRLLSGMAGEQAAAGGGVAVRMSEWRITMKTRSLIQDSPI